ncbi:MAG: osmoprotectant NAGGN system M42 family peptidase [Rhodothalassiaceae bacterium]
MERLRIDTDYLTDKLSRLLATPSPTGYTDEVVHFMSRELDDLGVPYDLTRRGAIRSVIKGEEVRPARAIIAHVDTLGAQVKRIKDNGRLELVPIGHWSSRFAEGARTTIFTNRGAYRGTILPVKASGHTFNEEIDELPVSWQHVELRADVPAGNRRDLERLGFGVGDFVAIDAQPEFLENGFIVSRHLDDKAGVALMLAALKAMMEAKITPCVDSYFLFSIAEEVGVGGSSVLHPDVASMITVDNGTTAPGQNSSEFGVTIAMADTTGPFDWHLTQKLIKLCEDYDIRYQRDIFRHYRSDSASALEAGNDIRTALIAFGIDASHGYERIHLHALRSLAELITVYLQTPVRIPRDKEDLSSLKGFTHQPTDPAPQGY